MRKSPQRKKSKISLLQSMILCAVMTLAFFGTSAFPLDIPVGAYSLGTNTVLAASAPNTDRGLIPCGRETDNSATENDETKDCTLCHLALIGNNLILLVFEIASVVALLALMVVSLMYVFAGANPVAKSQAHQSIIHVITGYVIIFTAWLIVDFVLSAWGFIDPLGGEWSVVCLFSSLF